MDNSSGLKPAKSPEASPLSPWSYGLRAAGEYQHSEVSSVPQSEELPQQHSWVVESLRDNPEFIQARFHIRRFVTVTIDTKADRDGSDLLALHSSLKTTSAQIDGSVRQSSLLQLLGMDLTFSVCRHWFNTLKIRIS
jgi:hypothetical protein